MSIQPQTATNANYVANLVLMPGLSDGIAVPHHERTLCAAVMSDPRIYLEIAPILHPRDFSDWFYGYFWKACEMVVQKGATIGYATITDTLHGMDSYEAKIQYTREQTIERLHDIRSHGEHKENATYFAEKIKESANRMRGIEAARSMEKKLRDTKQQFKTVLNEANREWYEATNQIETRKRDSASVAERTYQDMLMGNASFIKTGFGQIDDDLGGLIMNYTHLFVGNTGEGKSQFTMALIRQICTSNPDVGIAAFHYEMPEAAVYRNYYAMETGVYRQRMMTGDLEKHQKNLLAEAKVAISTWSLWTYDDPSLNTIDDVQRIVRNLQAQNPQIKQWLVVLDGLWLMSDPTIKAGMRVDNYNGIHKQINEVKGVNNLNCAFWVVHQYAGGGVSADATPTLENIEGKGFATHTPEVIWALKRWVKEPTRQTEIIGLKRRGFHDQLEAYKFEYWNTHALYSEPITDQEVNRNVEF